MNQIPVITLAITTLVWFLWLDQRLDDLEIRKSEIAANSVSCLPGRILKWTGEKWICIQPSLLWQEEEKRRIQQELDMLEFKYKFRIKGDDKYIPMEMDIK